MFDLARRLLYDRYRYRSADNVAYLNSTTAVNNLIGSLQGGTGLVYTRAQIADFDTTALTFDVSYNKVFNAGGFHTIKGTASSVVNDINSYYPGGFCRSTGALVRLRWRQPRHRHLRPTGSTIAARRTRLARHPCSSRTSGRSATG
jgi:hypothetical protein